MCKGKKILGAALLTIALCGSMRTGAKAAEVKSVKQTSCTETSVTVRWAANSAADHYQCSLSDGLSEIVKEDITTTKYTFSGLKAGTSYQMLVYAYQGDELIAASEGAYEVVTSPGISSFRVAQKDASKSSVTLSVSGAEGANYYIVKKTGDNGEVVAEGASSKLKVKELSDDKKYTFKVYAVRRSAEDYNGYTSKSYKKVSAKTVTTAIKAESFGVTKMDFKNNKYTFGLKESYGVDGYELQLRTMEGKEAKTKASTGMKTVLIEDLIRGHFYKYRVRTYVNCQDGAKAYSSWSKDKYIGVAKDARGSIAASLKSIKITWDKVIDASAYEVSVSLTGKDSDYRVIKKVSASSARRIVVNRVLGSRIRMNRKYYFRIVPLAMDGKSEVRSEYTNDVVVIRK